MRVRSSRTRKQTVDEVLGIDMVAASRRCDSLVEGGLQPLLLVFGELSVRGRHNRTCRLKVYDLTFRKIRWLVEDETAILHVSSERMHRQ
jgi:hypothetical protein